jgi:hypothetical protein
MANVKKMVPAYIVVVSGGISTTLAEGQNGGRNDKCVEEDGPSGYGSSKWRLLFTTLAQGPNGGLNGIPRYVWKKIVPAY